MLSPVSEPRASDGGSPVLSVVLPNFNHGWLWLRFRPVSLVGLSLTRWARHRERSNRRSRPPPGFDSSKPGEWIS